MTQRESHPIPSEQLDSWIPDAESCLKAVKGRYDLEEILRGLSVGEKYRTTPEELTILYAVRRGTCHYYYFSDLLKNSTTGLKKDIEDLRANGGTINLTIQKKQKFCSAFGFFVMASSIVATCEKKLKGKDQSKLAQIDATNFDLVVGSGFTKDINYILSEYVDALEQVKSNSSIQSYGDIISVTRDFWKAVINKATQIAKESPELLGPLANTTFHHGPFRITGLMTEDAQEANKVISWTSVYPNEIIGDRDVTQLMIRWCDRIALYDPIVQRNPILEFGGLIESAFLDGPPGSGKTTREMMMMTHSARRSEETGVPYTARSLTADQIKNEYYGTTSKLLKVIIELILDPSATAGFFLDDIDMLMSGARDAPGVNGADKDIMKGLMDFFAGIGTNYRGNYMTVAATNKPTSSDDAIRQRFVYRAIINGPKTWQDYADQSFLELRKFAKTGLLEVGTGNYEPLTRNGAALIQSDFSSELLKKHSHKTGTFDDIGHLCEELRNKDPKFTGRSVKNAIQVAIAKAADFDIPNEWFTDPSKFRAKAWDERISMLKEMYKKLSTNQILMALENQFEIEARYRREAEEQAIADKVKEMYIYVEAQKRLEKNERR